MAASAVFLDTNGWVALLNAGDALHATASTPWKNLGQRDYSILVTEAFTNDRHFEQAGFTTLLPIV